MKLLLVRHGETEENVSGIIQGQRPGTLTEKGKLQVAAIAKRLQSEKIDRIFSSDLSRARLTVEAIAASHALQISYSADLRERCQGIYEGGERDVYYSTVKKSGLSLIAFRAEGGESIYDVQKRTDRFLDSIWPQYQGQNVLVCAHGGSIKTIYTSLFKLALEDVFPRVVDNASLTSIEILAGREVRELCFNSVDHLADVSSELLSVNKSDA